MSLHPKLQRMQAELLTEAEAAGLPLVVTEGYRSPERQAKLYAQGRTAPGPVVTRAPPGFSMHEYGLAFDVAVLKDGKATWPNDLDLWEKIGQLGESVGLEWGGRFKTIVDRPHFQFTGGLRIEDLRAGKRLPNE